MRPSSRHGGLLAVPNLSFALVTEGRVSGTHRVSSHHSRGISAFIEHSLAPSPRWGSAESQKNVDLVRVGSSRMVDADGQESAGILPYGESLQTGWARSMVEKPSRQTANSPCAELTADIQNVRRRRDGGKERRPQTWSGMKLTLTPPRHTGTATTSPRSGQGRFLMSARALNRKFYGEIHLRILAVSELKNQPFIEERLVQEESVNTALWHVCHPPPPTIRRQRMSRY